jgi:cellulose synthase/poly-beta-1,6-N-acetylglucosamine synthase-like glycosyltransferase
MFGTVLRPLRDISLVVTTSWFIVFGILLNIAVRRNARWIEDHSTRNRPSSGHRRYLVIVPTVGEPTLGQTLDAVYRMERSIMTKLRLVVVAPTQRGSAVESVGANLNEETVESTLWLAPDDQSSKAGMLNYVLDRLETDVGNYDYVIMVDSDTLPAEDLLVQLDSHARTSRTGPPIAF